MTPSVDIVVVTFNARAELEACLDSLREAPPSRPHTIVVVDNASSDGTPAWLQAQRPDVRLIANAANAGFAGAYAFSAKANFGKIFPRFLTGLPDGGLIMCHPGFVDAELERLDSLTTLREREFAYFNSDEFLHLLARQGVELARPAGNGDNTT